MRQFTIDDLWKVLHASAGASEHPPSDETADLSFDELGYDSLAILELTSRLERDYGVQLSDEEAAGLRTPRQVTELVNDRIAKVGS